MTDEKKVEIWDKAYKSTKSVRETLVDIYELGELDGIRKVLKIIEQLDIKITDRVKQTIISDMIGLEEQNDE